MHTLDIQIYLLIITGIVILSIVSLITYNRLENKNQNRLAIFRYKENTKVNNDENPLILYTCNILDPLEEKLLNAIILPINRDGLSVDQLNVFLNLYDLQESNQRQRRHKIIKELNLKLYVVTGTKETIIRTCKRSDKRIKYYTLDLKSVEKIKKIADILLINNNQYNSEA